MLAVDVTDEKLALARALGAHAAVNGRAPDAAGQVSAHIHRTALGDVNSVFAAMKAGTVDGRMVIDMGLTAEPRHVERAVLTA